MVVELGLGELIFISMAAWSLWAGGRAYEARAQIKRKRASALAR